MKKVGPVVRFADLKKDGMIIETRRTRLTNTGSPAAVCIASCYLPDYYSNAPKQKARRTNPASLQQHRRLLNSLGGKVLHVFPLDLNQVPALSNPLFDLALTLRVEQDCCLLDKLQAAPLVLIQIGLKLLVIRVRPGLCRCWCRRWCRFWHGVWCWLGWMHSIPAHDPKRSCCEQHYCDY